MLREICDAGPHPHGHGPATVARRRRVARASSVIPFEQGNSSEKEMAVESLILRQRVLRTPGVKLLSVSCVWSAGAGNDLYKDAYGLRASPTWLMPMTRSSSCRCSHEGRTPKRPHTHHLRQFV